MTNFLNAPIEHKVLRSSAFAIPPLAWGMWRFQGTGLTTASRLVCAALDHGFTLFDTADIYGPDNGESFGAAEALLGRVLESDPSLRGRFVLATKGGIEPGAPYNSSAKYLLAACEASLARLKTETIDLYQIHRPDTLAHPHEIADALSQLRRAGKIRAAGVSNYSVAQTRTLQSYLPFPLASHQPEFSALHIEPLTDGVLDHAMEQHMTVLAWSPLAGGRLGGDGTDQRSRDVIRALDLVAAREALPRSAVALAWVLAHPSRPTALVGTQNPAHLAEAARALEVRFTRTDWYAILAASRQAPLP